MGLNTLSEEQQRETAEVEHKISKINDGMTDKIKEHRSKCGLKQTEDQKLEDDLVSDARIKAKGIMDELVSLERKRHGKTVTELITKNQFISIVSHDLQSPLSTIKMGLDLMREEHKKGNFDKCPYFMDLIERNANQMSRLITDLLDIERMNQNKLHLSLKKEDLDILIKECKESFDPITRLKCISLGIECPEEPFYASIDTDRIAQVVSNLIGNAIKYTPKDGTIKIVLTNQGDKFKISVIDSGPGIDLSKRDKIFDKFHQLKSNDETGLGLGLYISRWIVEAHNGTIQVESQPGQGCNFSFTIPVNLQV